MVLDDPSKYDRVRRLTNSDSNPYFPSQWKIYWWNNFSWEEYNTVNISFIYIFYFSYRSVAHLVPFLQPPRSSFVLVLSLNALLVTLNCTQCLCFLFFFTQSASSLLLKKMSEKEPECYLFNGLQGYKVDFTTMTQTNVTTGFKREVRCRPVYRSPDSMQPYLKSVSLVFPRSLLCLIRKLSNISIRGKDLPCEFCLWCCNRRRQNVLKH